MDSMTWWGTATCTYALDGLRLVTDPVLAGKGTTYTLNAPLGRGKMRYRNTGGTSATEELLAGADLALLSHDHHGDNLDEGGRRVLGTAALTLTTRAGAVRLRGAGLGNVVGLAPWESYVVDSVAGPALRVTATAARHGPLGTNWLAGPVIGFVIERLTNAGDDGRGPIYISGDTRYFSGVEEVARRFAPIELAVLHLGAARFGPKSLRRYLRFSMDAADAICAANALAPKRIVPVHFDGWSHFSEDQHAVAERFARAGLADRVRWLARGTATELRAL